MTIQVASAAVDTPRDGHFVESTRTLLLEMGVTNAWTRSEDLTNGAWSTDATSTVTGNATYAPDGALTADKVVESVANTTHYIYRGTGTITNSTLQTASIFAKAGERTWLAVLTRNKANVDKTSWVNLSTGAAGTTASGHTVRITAYVNGWYRIAVTFDASTGATTPIVLFQLATADGGGNYVGDGVSGLYLWGAQFEADKAFATSYIPTVASTVARSADSFSFPFSFTPQSLTLYFAFYERGGILTSASRVAQIGASGDTTPRVLIYQDSGMYSAAHDNGTTTSVAALGVAPSVGDFVELRIAISPTGSVTIGQSINSAAETTSVSSTLVTFGAAWSDTKLWLNSVGTSSVGAHAFTSAKVMRGVQTLATMRAA